MNPKKQAQALRSFSETVAGTACQSQGKERLMPENRNAHTASAGNEALEIVLRGVTIRLKFTAKQNEEVPALVRDILKTGWLRRKSA